MMEILGITLPFFGLMLLGYAAARFGPIAAEGLAGLNFFVFYFAMPALFFQLVTATPITESAGWSFVLTTTFSTYCAFALAFSFGALVNGGNVPEATIQGLVGSYGNVGTMAPGLTLAAFGPAAAAPTALIFGFDNAMLFTLVPLMMALGGTERAKPGAMARDIARKVFLHPFVLATIAGFFAAAIGFSPPGPVGGFLKLLSSAAVPCALFSLGASLALRPLGRVPLDLPVLVAIKLVAHPLIVYSLLTWVGGFDPVWVHAAVLMAALPPAANVLVLARQYDIYAERASAGILVGTVASIATVTIALILLLNDIPPL
jgi:malonate transporter